MHGSLTRRIIFFLLAGVLLPACGVVHDTPVKVDEYLYSVGYGKYDFESLSRKVDFLMHGKSRMPKPAACSAIRCDSLFGRNFDWFYDEMPEFVIEVRPDSGKGCGVKYASIGVAAPLAVLKDSQVYRSRGRLVLNLLPLFTVDGINENGVACCVNVVPQGDCGCTTGTASGKSLMYAGIAVRYVLDNAESAEDAVEKLRERCIYTTTAFGMKEDFHYMIADSLNTFVVEFVDNEMVVLDDEKIMTNYYLSRGVTPHAQGLERYDALAKGYAGARTPEGMYNLLKSIWFTGLYDENRDPQWLSDVCSINDPYGLVTEMMESDPDAFTEPLLIERDLYRSRSRSTSETFQSVHTSIYDIRRRQLSVSSQESCRQHVFRLGTQPDTTSVRNKD